MGEIINGARTTISKTNLEYYGGDMVYPNLDVISQLRDKFLTYKYIIAYGIICYRNEYNEWQL